MSPVKRVLLLILASASLIAAMSIAAIAGLPDRATYSGTIADGSLYAPEIGALAPPFSLARYNGGEVDLQSLRGSPVVINFWATWCGPCAVEMPELQTLYDEMQASGVRIVGVNLSESPQAVAAWSQQYGLTFDLVLDYDGAVAALYRLRGQPSTYILSSDGIIQQIFYGPSTRSQLEAALLPLL